MVAKNIFIKGLDKDTNKNLVKNENYINAKNIKITGDDNFWEISNMLGTKSVFKSIDNLTNVNILASVDCVSLFKAGYDGQVNDEYRPTIVYFIQYTSGVNNFSEVNIFDINNERVISKFLTSDDEEGFPTEGTIDVVVNSERNLDVLYWVDNKTIPKRLELSWDDDTTVLEWRTLSLLRYAPINPINITDVKNTGSLLAGSYAFSYRYYNTETGLYSKYSSFTNEVPIFASNESSVYSGAKTTGDLPGTICPKSILLSIGSSNDIKNLYDSIQLVIQKRIDGVKSNPTIVYRTSPKKEYYNGPIVYSGSEIEERIQSAEVSVSDAPIKTAKTIEIKDNRIFLGNVTYFNRILDSVVIDNARTEERNVSNYKLDSLREDNSGYKNPLNCCHNQGYFRGEVYRFGLVAMDKFGNWSSVQVLDFSQLESALTTDVNSFPERTITNIISSGGDTNGIKRCRINDPSILNNIPTGRMIKFTDSTRTKVAYREYVGYFLAIGFYVDWIFIGGDDFGFDPFYATPCVGASNENFAEEGIDFKFIPRDNTNKTILTVNQELVALGLKLIINDASTFPDWAVAFQVVRTERIKNILDQTIHIPSFFAVPKQGEDGPEAPKEGANPLGTIAIKNLGYAPNRNIYPLNFTLLYLNQLGGVTGSDDVASYSTVYAPTWLYNYKGESYSEDLVFSNQNITLRQVDAVSFHIPDNDISRPFGPFDDFLLTLMNTRSYQSYFFKRGNGLIGGDFRYSEGFDEYFTSPNTKILASIPLFTGDGPATIPYFSKDAPGFNGSSEGTLLSKIVDYLDVNGSILENGNLSGTRYEIKKNLFLLMEGKTGDLTHLCMRSDETTFQSGIYNSVIFNQDNSDNIYEAFLNLSQNTNDYFVPNSWNNFCTPICNIEKGLNDDRYGNIYEEYSFKQTGYYYELNNNNTITADVFGGDCFIGVQRIKTQNSNFTLWDTGNSVPSGPENVLSAFLLHSQHLSFLIESEINTSLHCDKNILPVKIDYPDNGVDPIPTPSPYLGKTDYDYSYNFAYTPNNSLVKFFSLNETQLAKNVNIFPSRIVYSNQVVGQSDPGNFSIFSSLDFYDLESTFRGITKLESVNNDTVFAIQERGVCIVPINKSNIQTENGGIMSVTSGQIINKPYYISTSYGCKHIRTVSNNGSYVYFADTDKRKVLRFNRQGLEPISDVGMHSYFMEKLDNVNNLEKNLSSVFDFNNQEYILFSDLFIDGFVVVWSEKVKGWVTEIDVYPSFNKLKSFIFANKELYVLGVDSQSYFKIEKMYEGDTYFEILGQDYSSKFDFVVNPEPTKGKIFDNMSFASNNRLSSMTLRIEKENSTDDVSKTHDMNLKPRHDCYLLPTLRTQTGNKRMRGKYMIAECTILPTEKEVRTSSVETIIRPDNRIVQ